MTEVELAWFTGLFEGEGCIYVKDDGQRRAVSVQIIMTDLDILKRCQTLVGAGKIYVKPTPDDYKQRYQWIISKCDTNQRLLQAMLPMLGERRRAKAVEALVVLADMIPRSPKGVIQHGTYAGYQQERRAGMETCPACRQAKSAYERNRVS
jgi:hypothetical protein